MQNHKIYEADGSLKHRSKIISKSIVREPLLPVEPKDVSTFHFLEPYNDI